MNRKQFLLLVTLACLAGSAGFWVWQSNHESWQTNGSAMGSKVLPGLAINDVARMTLQSGTNVLELVRQDNVWQVRQRSGYPANFQQLSDVLMKLSNLKIVQSQVVGPSQLGRFDLLPPGTNQDGGTLLLLQDSSGKNVASLLLGKTHQHQSPVGASQGFGDGSWPDGRYVLPGQGSSVALVSDPLDSLQTAPDQWLDKDFLSITRPASVSIQLPDATNDWKLDRVSDTNDWVLASAQPGEKLDPAQVSSVTAPFSSSSFNDVAPLNAQGSDSLTNAVLTVKTFDGLLYVIHAGAVKDDNVPVSFEISATGTNAAEKLDGLKLYQHWVYLMPSYSVDEWLKSRRQLLVTQTNGVTADAASH